MRLASLPAIGTLAVALSAGSSVPRAKRFEGDVLEDAAQDIAEFLGVRLVTEVD
jgi:hypothetical protein